jgi:GGDEF domain-containing protein
LVHLLRTMPAVRRRPARALAACLALVCAQGVSFVACVGEAWASAAVVMGVLAAGALVPSRRDMAAVVLGTVGGWSVVAAPYAADPVWRDHAVHVSTAVLVAALLHTVQRRTVDRLVRAQEQVRAVALTDELTGLANRRGFLTAGRPLLELSRRHGRSASVLLLDLDGLKHVNDTRGHPAGDALIAAAADVLRRATGPDDVCARLGGDELTVLLHGSAAAGGARTGGLARGSPARRGRRRQHRRGAPRRRRAHPGGPGRPGGRGDVRGQAPTRSHPGTGLSAGLEVRLSARRPGAGRPTGWCRRRRGSRG